MKEQDNIQEELKGLSDRLSNLKSGKDPMSVPDGYFDRLEGAVFARLEAEGTRVPVADAPKGWKVWLSPTRLSVAAAVATLAVAAIWWLRPQPDPLVAALDTEITPEMAEAYIIEHIGDFEEEIDAELADQLADVPVESNTNDSPTPKPRKKSKKLDDDLEAILDDLTEEELEELL